jgi:hypothetical protein
MPHPASSSRSAAIAGTLAGLLAAGLGGYFLYHRPAEPVASRAPAAAPAARPPVQAAPPATRPPAAHRVTKEQASRALMALPELKAWSEKIERESGGSAHGALLEEGPQPRMIDGAAYWQFGFVENSAQAARRWESFLVPADGGGILVDDPAAGELLNLQRWRAEKHPMQRAGAD